MYLACDADKWKSACFQFRVSIFIFTIHSWWEIIQRTLSYYLLNFKFTYRYTLWSTKRQWKCFHLKKTYNICLEAEVWTTFLYWAMFFFSFSPFLFGVLSKPWRCHSRWWVQPATVPATSDVIRDRDEKQCEPGQYQKCRINHQESHIVAPLVCMLDTCLCYRLPRVCDWFRRYQGSERASSWKRIINLLWNPLVYILWEL